MYKLSGAYRAVFQFFCFFSLFSCVVAPGISAAQSLSPLVIEQADGSVHSFQVELALTNKQRQKGLMHRTDLGASKGMLFIFETEKMRSFWMRNTLIPLDIIFLRADGSIVNIVTNAEPQTDNPRPSTGPAKAVLELAGGRAAELGIVAGDIVRHVLLGNVKSQK